MKQPQVSPDFFSRIISNKDMQLGLKSLFVLKRRSKWEKKDKSKKVIFLLLVRSALTNQMCMKPCTITRKMFRISLKNGILDFWNLLESNLAFGNKTSQKLFSPRPLTMVLLDYSNVTTYTCDCTLLYFFLCHNM